MTGIRNRFMAILLVLVLLSVGGAVQALADEQSEPIELEWFVYPIIGTPLPDKSIDPYYNYLLEKFNVDVTLTVSSDFQTELLARFVAGNAPDMIAFPSESSMVQLYEQGVLIEDWTPYLETMPSVAEGMGNTAIDYYTRDGALAGLTIKANGQKWLWEIRKDWLEALDKEVPQTVDELLDVARAFTFNDPDGNGADDTYAFSSAGANASIGEISNLVAMFSPPSWYVDEETQTVSHPYLNGGHQQFLDFMRIIVQEGLIDPDWYTQKWDDRKPDLFAGAYGIMYYPPMALLNEIAIANPDAPVEDWWTMLGMPEGSDIGGKTTVSYSSIGSVRSISKEASEDPEKMEVITAIFEDIAWPNYGAHTLMYGRDIDDYIFIELEGGYLYYDRNNADGSSLKGVREDQYESLWDWAVMLLYEDPYVIQGTSPEPNEVTYAFLDMEKTAESFEYYDDDYFQLVFDQQLLVDCAAIVNEFEIKYILGQTDDYEGFVEQWLAAGGQEMLESATEQFAEKGKLD